LSLNLHGTGQHRHNGVGNRHARVIVAMNTDIHVKLAHNPGGNILDFIRECSSIGIAKANTVRSGLNSSFEGFIA